MTLSPWMQGAGPSNGGLLVPARPKRRGCDIVFAPEGARVSVDELVADLPYEHYGSTGSDTWAIGAWAYGRGGEIGMAVTAGGSHADPIGQMYKRRRRLLSAANRYFDRTKVAPLYAAHTISLRTDGDRDALDVLCRVLARRPDWRPQLADPERVTRFLRDMWFEGHHAIPEKTGLGRRSVETFMVMQKLGFVHQLEGRPLPDEPPLDDEAVVQAVMDGLAANRYALPPVKASVSALVHRHYLDVRPWPFAALLPAGSSETTTRSPRADERPR